MAIGSTIPFTAIPWDDVLFVLLAGTMLAAGLAVVVMKDIIRCGLAMMVCFAALAGLYVMAGAPLVGAAQVLVYIGAISVLVLFAIMLTQTKSAPTRLAFQTQAVPAAVAAIVLLVVVLLSIGSTTWGGGSERGDTNTADVARALFGPFVLPFEIVGVLLLAAVIGGVFLAKREGPRPGGAESRVAAPVAPAAAPSPAGRPVPSTPSAATTPTTDVRA